MHDLAKELRDARDRFGVNSPEAKAAFAARWNEVLDSEPLQPRVWFLSFASGEDFLGGVFVEANSMSDAIRKTHEIGVNPGGEVLSFSPSENTARVPVSMHNRLLSKQEIIEGVKK